MLIILTYSTIILNMIRCKKYYILDNDKLLKIRNKLIEFSKNISKDIVENDAKGIINFGIISGVMIITGYYMKRIYNI
ncbi:hypothetical protein [Caldisphaera sp.]|uniref:hypothetical protein n=1 Tax=Caldisphaera sp. TaxID=2060322 RepID=UPI003D1478EF